MFCEGEDVVVWVGYGEFFGAVGGGVEFGVDGVFGFDFFVECVEVFYHGVETDGWLDFFGF